MLLEQLFAPACRPTLRWLQAQRKAGRVPCFKLGQLVFFDPAAVRAAFATAGEPVGPCAERGSDPVSKDNAPVSPTFSQLPVPQS